MTDRDTLPDGVRRLVQTHVPSPAHLEALVVVARDPERSWSAADVAACTALAEAPIAAGLRDLAASGVLEEATADGNSTYRVRTDTTEQRGLMQELVTAFDRVPVQLIRAVYSRPSDPVQSFADAFRIQRPK